MTMIVPDDLQALVGPAADSETSPVVGAVPAHVLVAEDDRKHAEILRRYLQSAGYRITVTHDGTTALDRARRLRPDLLLIDVMMPGMNGLDLCEVLRRESSVPVLMLTARTSEEDLLTGLDRGADDYPVRSMSVACVDSAIRIPALARPYQQEWRPATDSSRCTPTRPSCRRIRSRPSRSPVTPPRPARSRRPVPMGRQTLPVARARIDDGGRGVITMSLAALLTIMVVLLLVVSYWALVSAPSTDDARPAKDLGRPRAPVRPDTLEGVLVRQLIEKEISGPQYRRDMQRLAERDAERHPMTVPPQT